MRVEVFDWPTDGTVTAEGWRWCGGRRWCMKHGPEGEGHLVPDDVHLVWSALVDGKPTLAIHSHHSGDHYVLACDARVPGHAGMRHATETPGAICAECWELMLEGEAVTIQGGEAS